MKQILKANSYFFLPYLLFLLVCTYFLFSYSRPELHILTNEANSDFFDVFFKNATHLGDGLMVLIFAIIFLFVSYRNTLAFLIGSLFTSGIVQLFKRVILDDMYRPSKYFELHQDYQLHIIEGVKLHSLNSFPSGHSATAFNVFLMLTLVTPNKLLKVLFFILAAVTAYSRVYLSQHFLVDITVGSLTGTVFMLIVYWWSMKWDKNWLDQSVTDLFQLK